MSGQLLEKLGHFFYLIISLAPTIIKRARPYPEDSVPTNGIVLSGFRPCVVQKDVKK